MSYGNKSKWDDYYLQNAIPIIKIFLKTTNFWSANETVIPSIMSQWWLFPGGTMSPFIKLKTLEIIMLYLTNKQTHN